MGSSTSRPRKGHEEHHLPKVGSPSNQEWEHETHRQLMFGSPVRMAILGVLLVGAVAGLLILNL